MVIKEFLGIGDGGSASNSGWGLVEMIKMLVEIGRYSRGLMCFVMGLYVIVRSVEEGGDCWIALWLVNR